MFIWDRRDFSTYRDVHTGQAGLQHLSGCSHGTGGTSAHMAEMKNAYTISVGKNVGRIPLERPRLK
jgi:hypothetical protein